MASDRPCRMIGRSGFCRELVVSRCGRSIWRPWSRERRWLPLCEDGLRPRPAATDARISRQASAGVRGRCHAPRRRHSDLCANRNRICRARQSRATFNRHDPVPAGRWSRPRRLRRKLCPHAIAGTSSTAAYPSIASVSGGWWRRQPWANTGSRWLLIR